MWALWAPGAFDHGPYGPQGPWAQPLFDCVGVPSRVLFSAKKASDKKTKNTVTQSKRGWAQGPWGP